jgi:hypothetical protein
MTLVHSLHDVPQSRHIAGGAGAAQMLVLSDKILQFFRHPEAELKERVEPHRDATDTFVVAQDKFDLR